MKVAAVLGAGALAGSLLCAAPAALGSWSYPARLAGCAKALPAAPVLIVFPSSEPQVRSGPGALLWTGPRGCGGSAPSVFGARLGPQGLPGPGRALSVSAGGLAEIDTATGTTSGQVVVAGGSAPDAAIGRLVEGRAVGTFPAARSLGGPAAPVVAVSGYLGDAVLVSTVATHRRWELAVRSQRHYGDSLTAPRLLPVGSRRPSALAVAMDYRSDLLVVWASGGEIYARAVAQAGAVGPVQRLGGGGPDPELQALISDDGRAIVAWRSQVSASAVAGNGAGAQRHAERAAASAATSVEVSISDASLHFARPTLVERFRDVRGLAPAGGSLRLTRMSSEAVMMAWTGMQAGRYVVRASPVSLHRGVWAPVTVSTSAAGTDATLADLVSGPRAEVLALWTTAPRGPGGGSDPGRRAIAAAWGHYGGHGEAVFAAPEVLAAAGPNGTPVAAFDPQSDRALAAWTTDVGTTSVGATGAGTTSVRTPGVGTLLIVYAQRTAGPPAAVAGAARGPRQRRGGALRDVALAALGLLLLAAAAAWRQRTPLRG